MPSCSPERKAAAQRQGSRLNLLLLEQRLSNTSIESSLLSVGNKEFAAGLQELHQAWLPLS